MSKKGLPLVSICIPTYNGANYIKDAMTSALLQDYANLEVVISDDASKDDTLSVVESFVPKTLIPIRIYLNEHKGIGANWNHCVKQAKGEYIKFLFQDDLLAPNCISRMVAMAEVHPNVALVYSKREFLYTELSPKLKDFMLYYGPLHTYWSDFKVSEGVLSGRAYLKDQQFMNSPKNKIGEPTNVLLRRECFETIGYFSEDLQQALDSDYWYRVMTHYDVGFIDAFLAQFRLHDSQASILNKQRDIPDEELIYRRYYDYLYTYLHPKNKLKLLKLYHPFFKTFVKLKRLFYVR